MSKEEKQRMGRLMAVGWGLLQVISKTPWLLVLIFPFMSAITYDKQYRRDWLIPVVATGRVSFDIHNLDTVIKIRPLANKKGSILTVDIVAQKTSYSWALGIA